MNISDEAVEALARRNYKAEWDDGWDGVLPTIKRSWLNEARAQCEAAAPYLMASGFVRGYQSALADRTPINQDRSRRAPRWSRKQRSAGAGE